MLNIRHATDADDDAIVRVLISAFAHLYARMGIQMSPSRRAYLSGLASRRDWAISFVCEVDG